jgi:outer membrane protein OmpA-like peptidoglycan-associated protein
MKTYLLILLGLMLLMPAAAQVKRADKKFDRLAYAPAIKFYQKALKKDPTSWHVTTRLADCYRLINDSKNAEYWYNRAVKNPSTDPINLFYYGQSLMHNQKWEQAVPWFEKFLDLRPNDPLGTSMLNSSRNYEDFMRDSTLYNVKITNVNTEAADWGTGFHGNQVVFSSARKKSEFLFGWNDRNFLDFYSSDYNRSSELGSPVRLKGKVNSKLHEGGVTFSGDGQVMFFSRNNIYRGKIGSSKEGVILLKTYRADYRGKRWKKIKGIPFNSNDYSVGHPALSPDGKLLFFASDMPGGEGGTDIYVVNLNLETNEWGKPVNLGPTVNTPGNEMFPWTDENGTLYFASNGHEGLGGLDIFVCYGYNTSEPRLENIGYPINTSRDDFALIMDTRAGVGFFSSNRPNGVGDDDIYSFTRKQVFKGIVVDAATGQPIENARVEIYDVSRLQGTGRTDPEGITRQGIFPNRDYKVVVSKEGYQEKSEFVTSQGVPIIKDILLKVELEKEEAACDEVFALEGVVKDFKGKLLPGTRVKLVTKEQLLVADENGELAAELLPDQEYTLSVDDPAYKDKVYDITTAGKDPKDPIQVEIVLGDPDSTKPFYIIYYNFDKHDIRPGDARPELDRVVNYMNRKTNLKVLLTSHTDSRGSDAYNETLSKNRAIEAYDYIVGHGIAKDRLRYEWKGEKELTNQCKNGVECTKEEHQRNRRTEFRFDGNLSDPK